jgi:YesN/AraC family two-component response regulator
VYVDAGEVTVTAGTEKYVMRQGDFFLHRPLEFHAIACSGGTANAIVFSFSSDCEKLYSAAGKIIKCSAKQKVLMSEILDEGKNAFSDPLNDVYLKKLHGQKTAPFGSVQSIKNLMELLFIGIIRGQATQNKVMPYSSEDLQIREICNHIDSHLAEPLKFEDLCKEFSIGKTALKKLFREHLGCGAMEYYNTKRISEAKKMLREKKYSVTEISDTLQFSTIHYFCRKFKQATNMTPLEYQRSVSSLVKNFFEK